MFCRGIPPELSDQSCHQTTPLVSGRLTASWQDIFGLPKLNWKLTVAVGLVQNIKRMLMSFGKATVGLSP